MGRASGLSADKLNALPDFEKSPALSEVEKAALRYAMALTSTPAEVSDELFAELRRHFNDRQMIELTATVAWENYRARFNRAFLIGSDHLAEGAVCLLPERPPTP